ncbi:hypothetical protein [Eikenella sp. NML03-A-027]|uniref:hypothetical protein n=1 Tax=Eikenella sp. NML03-A-027 TaxID=1795828 RepID=UPI000AE6D709|nr:hypothetical protein [Eikenella sp. NML03-A-027]
MCGKVGKNNGGIVLGLPVKQNKAKGYLKNGCGDFQVAFSSLKAWLKHCASSGIMVCRLPAVLRLPEK